MEMTFVIIHCTFSDIILSEKVPLNGKFSEVAQASDEGSAVERIVGGRNATCDEFPHQVSFVVNNSYFCGGFIISEQYIMTAAHCAQEYVLNESCFTLII